jgi:plastocyanin
VITKADRGVPFRTWRRALACAGAALVLLQAGGSPSAGETGRIAGRVILTAPVALPLASAAYATRRVERVSAPATSEINNVVVFVQDAPRTARAAAMRARIAQQGETFVPRVVAVTRGSTIDFPNGDPYFHDVFSLSRAASFDLGSYPRGSSRSWQFHRAGIVKVYCHIHSHMSASILVFDHPYFAIPHADGSFTIDDLPAGTYHVSAWHERIGENVQSVRVDPGRSADIEFSLPVATR